MQTKTPSVVLRELMAQPRDVSGSVRRATELSLRKGIRTKMAAGQ